MDEMFLKDCPGPELMNLIATSSWASSFSCVL